MNAVKDRLRALSCLAMLAGALLAAGGCGDDSDSSSDTSASGSAASSESTQGTGSDATVVDADGVPVRIRGWAEPAKTEYKIAWFGVPASVPAEVAADKALRAVEEHLKVDVTFFEDNNFDATQQLTQIDQATATGDFDGYIAATLDPSVTCKALTDEAAAKDIQVVITNSPLCEAREDGYTPGTAGYSGSQTQAAYRKYLDHVFAELEPESEFAVIAGPANLSINRSLREAVDEVSQEYPEIDVVEILNGDYSVAAGVSMMNTILSKHSDIAAIYSAYDDQTYGAISALKARGKSPGDVKVYQLGSASRAFDFMRQGWINGMFYYDPANQTSQGLEMVVAALQGRKYPRVNDISADPSLPHGTAYITPDTVEDYTPIG